MLLLFLALLGCFSFGLILCCLIVRFDSFHIVPVLFCKRKCLVSAIRIWIDDMRKDPVFLAVFSRTPLIRQQLFPCAIFQFIIAQHQVVYNVKILICNGNFTFSVEHWNAFCLQVLAWLLSPTTAGFVWSGSIKQESESSIYGMQSKSYVYTRFRIVVGIVVAALRRCTLSAFCNDIPFAHFGHFYRIPWLLLRRSFNSVSLFFRPLTNTQLLLHSFLKILFYSFFLFGTMEMFSVLQVSFHCTIGKPTETASFSTAFRFEFSPLFVAIFDEWSKQASKINTSITFRKVTRDGEREKSPFASLPSFTKQKYQMNCHYFSVLVLL